MPMEEKAKQQYICQEPAKCPYCITKTLVRENLTCIGKNITCDVTCTKCNRKWRDIYIMTNESQPLSFGNIECQGENVTSDAVCPKCGNTWKNVFELIDVIEDDA